MCPLLLTSSRDPTSRLATLKMRQHHLHHGNTIKAMGLNGFGLVEKRLYFYPDFFSDIAIDRLLGDGVTTVHLNDDLGRMLAAIGCVRPDWVFHGSYATPCSTKRSI